MRHHTTFAVGAVFAAIGVALGAFGAHGLKDLVEPAMLANWETGVRYQMYAALALMALGLRPEQRRAPWPILVGGIIFSGTLCLMALTGMRWLGAITPIGGALIIAGLLLAAWDVRRVRRTAPDQVSEAVAEPVSDRN
ncbi:DUF423 domain-containing protein [Ammonicoccus fulvus]|uniref:DUF423 domain-containing protein n=1 Tax=Ammonicoccus fulvus TaxID=3138240 RepID=A0ABZ3FSM8_9ACTN